MPLPLSRLCVPAPLRLCAELFVLTAYGYDLSQGRRDAEAQGTAQTSITL
jgi:hypothetical protein